jgi:hypothetical protein
MVVMSPSYFIFEMEHVKILIKSSGVEEFLLKRKNFNRVAITMFSIFIITGTLGAFLYSYAEKQIIDKE